jgi:hypothetical protein
MDAEVFYDGFAADYHLAYGHRWDAAVEGHDPDTAVVGDQQVMTARAA